MSEYSGHNRREDDQRVRRIEEAVIKLEKDMAVMTKAITDLSDSVKTLADIRVETQLLKQDYEHSRKDCYNVVEKNKADIEELRQELFDLSRETSRNTWVSEVISKTSWFAVGGMISFIFWLIQEGG